MKKIFFGSVAAICAVASLTSFKQVSKSFATHYFLVLAGKGTQTQFVNADLASLGTSPGDGCNGGPYRCVVSFTENQIIHTNLGGSTILANTFAAPQTIVVTIYTRSEDN